MVTRAVRDRTAVAAHAPGMTDAGVISPIDTTLASMRVLLPASSNSVTGSPDPHACPLHGAAVLLLALFTAVVMRRVLLRVLPGARRWMRACKGCRRLPPPLPSVHIDGVRLAWPSTRPHSTKPGGSGGGQREGIRGLAAVFCTIT